MSLNAIILAAGKGTRMKSEKVKVIHKAAGKPIINYVTDTVLNLGVDNIYLIVGHQAELVKEITQHPKMTHVLQTEQLGTGHAVMQVEPHLTPSPKDLILILAGDCPLISEATLNALIARHNERKVAGTVLTTEMPEPGSYGRIIRDENGNVLAIREAKDCSPEELKIREINTGGYCFQSDLLFAALKKVTPNNSQKEYYLTDVLQILKQDGHTIAAHCTTDNDEAIGINTRMDLAYINTLIYQRCNTRLMIEGVTIVDPKTTYITPGVKIGPDTIVHPCTMITGNSVIGANCEIGPHVLLEDVTIPDNTK